jgi:phosphate transport system substrate-binding protein
MTHKSSPPPIVYIVAVLAFAGGGCTTMPAPIGKANTKAPSSPAAEPATPVPSAAFTPPASVPKGTTLRIDGSTSMVTMNQNLKGGFEKKFPGTTVSPKAQGSQKGLLAVLAGSIDMAAVSQPLTDEEQSQGLVAVPVATNAIAIVVGSANPFSGGLTKDQVEDIFEGRISNWSTVGGPMRTIRVFNRSPRSGTSQVFKELVLKENDFGQTPNIQTIAWEATTPLLQLLKTDGISYATYTDVANQPTARTVPIDGLIPEATNYPYKRTLYYVYKQPPSPAVQAFLGYATSPTGKQVMLLGN